MNDSEELPKDVAIQIIAKLITPGVSNFLLPQAWTFDACDVEKVINASNSIERVKFFAALVDNPSGQTYLTLVMVGIDATGKEIYLSGNGNLVMYEYADPCPPKCGPVSSGLIPLGGYKEITVIETKSKHFPDASCQDYSVLTC